MATLVLLKVCGLVVRALLYQHCSSVCRFVTDTTCCSFCCGTLYFCESSSPTLQRAMFEVTLNMRRKAAAFVLAPRASSWLATSNMLRSCCWCAMLVPLAGCVCWLGWLCKDASVLGWLCGRWAVASAVAAVAGGDVSLCERCGTHSVHYVDSNILWRVLEQAIGSKTNKQTPKT